MGYEVLNQTISPILLPMATVSFVWSGIEVIKVAKSIRGCSKSVLANKIQEIEKRLEMTFPAISANQAAFFAPNRLISTTNQIELSEMRKYPEPKTGRFQFSVLPNESSYNLPRVP